MVRKKSINSKIKTRKEAYKRKKISLTTTHSWTILFLIMKAIIIFRRKRRHAAIAAGSSPTFTVLENFLISSSSVAFVTQDVNGLLPNLIDSNDQFEDFNIVQLIMKNIVSKVCLLELQRERVDRTIQQDLLNTNNSNQRSLLKRTKKNIWFKRKYSQNATFRNQKKEKSLKKFSYKYHNNTIFQEKHRQRIREQFFKKYHKNKHFQQEKKIKSKQIYMNKYHTNLIFHEQKIRREKNSSYDKYHTNLIFHDEKITREKNCSYHKYHTNLIFHEQKIRREKNSSYDKYHKNLNYRQQKIRKSKNYILNKYHNSSTFRQKYKTHMKHQVLQKYHNCNSIRLKMIKRALDRYRTTMTPMQRNLKRIYNQSRRIMKKYITFQSHKCSIKHRNLYKNNLKIFRKIIQEGPDYICISCQLALFRNQVIPYVENKYIKENMTYEIRERILSYVNYPLSTEKNWICKSCSDKIKKRQMPSRSIVNKLQVNEIPPELKNLNNLEKHLIALRLPFMKIVNLSSGKISNRFAQKGTKGPLHCVPSDVQETITSLPRPVDKSMMVRLQLKRRLKYKAVWEEQLINPHDIKDALIVLTKKHPGYKNIKINEINENYLTSDNKNKNENNNHSFIESIDVDVNERENSIEQREKSNEDRLKKLALGDIIDTVNNDEEIDEDNEDIRTKYNIGTDSCTQPSDFNDFLFFDKNPCVVAPAEKNKLSSLLTDKTIEALAFPHLFPDGEGSYDEERVTNLTWKEYCKARLFSSDSRFASDSSYIFFLQYLGDLKQVFSGINVAFRKKLPMTVKYALDEAQMKFLMNKDMIYRYLQSVRGSPQYWKQRLKDLFGMNRQVGFPTFFVTLSCADLRWKEFINTFARHSGTKIKESYTFEEKTKLLRANPVLAARLFEKRFTSFMNLFIKGGAWCLGKVKDWYARIEMQFRGSPHSHMPVWVEDAPKYNGPQTNEKTREEIVKFCDKYITTRFPSIHEDAELHNIIKEVQTHSRNHSKSCLKYHKTMCRFGFPRPVVRRTFICEPIKTNNNDDKKHSKKIKQILSEMNATMNKLEKEKILSWSDFDNLLSEYNWTYDDYEYALRVVHTRPTMIHKREPNARWVNQYNEEILRAWDANIDIQFVLDPYACAKYIMSYTTKPEREMSLLLEATHKECREGNMTVREEMKKLTGTFFNHRQVSVQEAIYRATKMPLTYSSRGFVFVPAHSNSCKFLKPQNILKQMNPDDDNIYMSNLADKYFDRPEDCEFDICMADFASEYEIISINRNIKNPKTPIKDLKSLSFAVKKRCGRNAIIRFPYFNQENDRENYFENLLSLYLPIRSRNDLKKPYELFYQTGEIFDSTQQCIRKVKDAVSENRKKYEAHFKEIDEMESLFNQLTIDMKDNEWAEIVANKEKKNIWSTEIEEEDNPDFNIIHKGKNKNRFIDLKQTYVTTNQMRPLLDSMNEEQQEIFYHVRKWCINRLHNSDIEPLRLFITGGAGTGKSHLLKCLHYEATRIFSRKKHLQPDENIDEIHTLITAFTGAAAMNVGGLTIHSAFGIGTQQNSLHDNLSCDKLNSYRCKLGSLKLLFVDEVSLIQASLWGAMHSRLTQIMGVNSNTAIFGNISIIAIGDFYQCSPVASSSIYSSMLWCDHFEYIEMKINERQKTNMSFAQMLNRIRKLKKKETMIDEDRKTLQKCHQRYLNKEYHPEALHLFAKNAQVDAHNEQMIEKICTDIRIFYEIDHNNREIKPKQEKQSQKTNKGLRLAKNARVMITKNICVSDGLANGVMGRIVGFVENDNKEVSHILIKCDLATIGRVHRNNCTHCQGHDTVCVVRENDNIDRQDNDFRSKRGTKQFPLRLSWAITIHKAQGITVPQVVMSTKDLFGTGMGYAGISRVPIDLGLFLSDLHFDKFYCNENIDKVVSQMKEMKKEKIIFNQSCQCLNILCHNIEGLEPNFNALQNHYLTHKADVICLTQTCSNNKNTEFQKFLIEGYDILYEIRDTCFQSDHILYSQKGGGVAVYFKKNLSIKKFDSCKHLNLEYITIEIEKFNITIITCYRSQQQNKNEFLVNLIEQLKKINMKNKILVVGDFNEDNLSNTSKPIETKLESLGFVNIFKGVPTTNSLTSLDCVYTNFILNKDKYREVIGTYYSFHDALILSINIENNQCNSNQEDELTHKDNMKINNCTQKYVSSLNEPEKPKKRKNDSTSNIYNKILKTLQVSTPAVKITYTMKEKQLHFLQNYNDASNKNILETLSNTFTVAEQLDSIGLKIIHMPADGNCFFRTISHQLYRHQNDHLKIRAETINYMISNINNLEPFIVRNIDPTSDNYIKRMSKDGTYVDHLVVSAAAVVINKNLIIHEINKKPYLIPGSDYVEHQIHLCYHPLNVHYDSVICIDGTSAFLPSEKLFFT